MEIKIERAKTLKTKPDQNHLGFGQYFTDHMFIMDWDARVCLHGSCFLFYT